jgi:hypothetical protein
MILPKTGRQPQVKAVSMNKGGNSVFDRMTLYLKHRGIPGLKSEISTERTMPHPPGLGP